MVSFGRANMLKCGRGRECDDFNVLNANVFGDKLDFVVEGVKCDQNGDDAAR